jgi:NAD-reducing hydrogenase small subunit
VEPVRLATVWLGGCSGCHMSLLDLDEFLIELSRQVELCYSPLADVKVYPEGVDAVLVEGAVSTDEQLEMIRRVRQRSRVLVAFGDCAVAGNVTALRNPLGSALPVLQRAYQQGHEGARIPAEPGIIPRLLDEVLPLHRVVAVDAFLPGCPPPAARIRRVLEAVVAGRSPQPSGADLRFG